MPVVTGIDRHQMQMLSLDMYVPEDSPLRLIDAFVDTLELEQLGFVVKGKSKEGRAAFTPHTLLRIYLYGYLYRIRSSRQLELACRRNIDLWWLVNAQQPCYKTISEFRRINCHCLKAVFRQWNLLCKEWDLFGEQTVAIDGSKFSAQNSRRNNFNQAKIDRLLKYIDNKTEAYLQLLDEQDRQQEDALVDGQQIREKIKTLQDRKLKYELIGEQLEQVKAQGERQVSTTDEDARLMSSKMNSVEMAYNVQSAADAKHSLIADFEVTNKKDEQALAPLAMSAKAFLEVDQLTVLADKGYHTGRQLEQCATNGITTFVAVKQNASSGKKHPDFRKNMFHYDEQKNVYICPQEVALTTKGRWYHKKGKTATGDHQFQRYEAPVAQCQACPMRDRCGPFSKGHGRTIDRNQYESYIEANKKRVEANKAFYRLRQQIVEHPFGTIKRQWGYSFTLLKTIPKVTADFSLIFLAYNMRRAITLIGVPELIKRLKALGRLVFCWNEAILRRSNQLFWKRRLEGEMKFSRLEAGSEAERIAGVEMR